ncbi:para-nitrobenzyl esterase [Maricurvus nonylphenolicus]|uniref:carboxylesterase/lipase family protein n=1 Tax=Maricurvus nonylphenolicus TaxID=1008307 RepID=UPI0036F3360A
MLMTLGVIILVVLAGLWFFFGHNLFNWFGPYRDRFSNLESWDKTAPIVTRLGQIIGLQKDTEKGRVMAFLGIRYGQAPIGDKRFKPATAAGGWEGTLDATRFPNAPIQPKADNSTQEPNMPVQSEDCLFLSVYTPSTEGANRPVLFWIHGGAFIYGTGNGYPGHVLAEQGDAVVVAINYRLGMLGFYDLSKFGDQYAGSASNGIRDQILALEWVRDNIADYGGDPNNVTIFGQSAGGASVSSLVCAPAADGLFHKAIVHSGMAVALPPHDYNPELQKALDLEQEKDIPAALTTLSTEEILKVQAKVGFFAGGNVDGTVISRSLKDAIHEQGKAGVPIIIGSNRDEGKLFSLIAPRIAFKAVIPPIASLTTLDHDTDGYLERLKQDHPGDSLKQLHDRVWTEGFISSAVTAAEWAAQAGRNVWAYRFEEPVQVNPFGYKLGACHAAELDFTFNNFARDDLGENSLWYDKNDPEIVQLGLAWSNTLIQFAKTGNPNGAGMPEWPQYTNSQQECMIVEKNPHVKSSVDKFELERWCEFREDGDELLAS